MVSNVCIKNEKENVLLTPYAHDAVHVVEIAGHYCKAVNDDVAKIVL